MRGRVLTYNDATGEGLISGDDGVRYSFRRVDLQQLVMVGPGTVVDFLVDAGVARQIFVLQAPGAASGGQYSPAYGAAAPFESSNENLSMWAYFTRAMTKKFIDGEGRARRKEYWSFILFYYLILSGFLITGYVLYMTGLQGNGYRDWNGSPVTISGAILIAASLLFALWAFIPAITILVRRLHDIGLSGWMILIGLIPYLGALVLLVMAVLPSEMRVNKHGPYPKPLNM
jgi:uncharacterized membrane protein YhaH (DUF805 family)/cold shock CspA family protein